MTDSKSHNNSKVRVGICPLCNEAQRFDNLPRIGKVLRCPACKRWLKVSNRLPIQLERL